MRVLNDFHCAVCDTVEEHFLENDVKQYLCQSCGGVARRVLTVPNFQLEGTSGDFPTAADKWVKSREQKMAQERKADNS